MLADTPPMLGRGDPMWSPCRLTPILGDTPPMLGRGDPMWHLLQLIVSSRPARRLKSRVTFPAKSACADYLSLRQPPKGGFAQNVARDFSRRAGLASMFGADSGVYRLCSGSKRAISW